MQSPGRWVFVLCASLLVAGWAEAQRGMPYEAFRRLPVHELKVEGGVVEVAFAEGQWDLPQSTILAWISRSAQAVARYYGRLPVPRAKILVQPGQGRGVHGGVTYAYRGAATKFRLGRQSTEADLLKDWVLTHEMTHWAFPWMSDEHHWIEEGLASYIEPLIRQQAGMLRPERVWLDLVRGLPQGLPQPGDQGLDGTRTWGRTYWGGALFCLLADVEIRQRTENRKSLRDALLGIVQAGGNIETSWSIRQALRIGDRATGTTVLGELYEKMKDDPAPVDLNALWDRLGVSVRYREVHFDDTAPLAEVRRGITEQSTGS